MLQPTHHSYHAEEQSLKGYREHGDVKILGLVLQQHTTLMLGVALKYLKDLGEAEEAVQAVLLKALENFPKEPVLNLKGWLYILMRNHCLQRLKDPQRHHQEIEPVQLASEEQQNTAAFLAEENILRQMENELQRLPLPQRRSLTLFYLQGKSYEYICEHTGYSYKQVKSYIQNGKKNLRNRLAPLKQNEQQP